MNKDEAILPTGGNSFNDQVTANLSEMLNLNHNDLKSLKGGQCLDSPPMYDPLILSAREVNDILHFFYKDLP